MSTRPDSVESTDTVEPLATGSSSVEPVTMQPEVEDESGKRRLGELTSRLFKLAWGLGALAIVGSAVMIAVEQRRQTSEMRKSGCYARAAAAAAVAATEIARSGSSGANPGLTFLECDQVAGIAP
jgi:hypothetical protein